VPFVTKEPCIGIVKNKMKINTKTLSAQRSQRIKRERIKNLCVLSVLCGEKFDSALKGDECGQLDHNQVCLCHYLPHKEKTNLSTTLSLALVRRAVKFLEQAYKALTASKVH